MSSLPPDPFAGAEDAAEEAWRMFGELMTAMMGKGFTETEARELALAIMLAGFRTTGGQPAR